MAHRFNFLCTAFLIIASATQTLSAQMFKNSVASTDFDYIMGTDPSAFDSLTPLGQRKCEMPDKRDRSRPLIQPAYVFEATFSDGTRVELNLSQDFGSQEAARSEVDRYTGPLGRLPTALRKGVRRVVVHKGGEDTTASSDIGLIMLFSDNASKRIANHDLEETVFHESVHATWDQDHASSPDWVAAQMADGGYITEYGRSKPDREDLAESALFAYTITHHPERFPEDVAKKIRETIPNRIAYVAKLLPADSPIFYPVEPHSQSVGETRTDDDDSAAARRSELPSESEDLGCCIRLSGVFCDVLSNSLLKMGPSEADIASFLADAKVRLDDSESIYLAAVSRFHLDPEELKSVILETLHVNCTHEAFDDSPKRNLVGSWGAPSPEKPKTKADTTPEVDSKVTSSRDDETLFYLRLNSGLTALTLLVLVALLVKSRRGA